jgi:hypothetical protein
LFQQIWSYISPDMIFGSIFTISEKGFLLNPKIHPAQTATRTPFLHPRSVQRDRQAGPMGQPTPPVGHPKQGDFDRPGTCGGVVTGGKTTTLGFPSVMRFWPTRKGRRRSTGECLSACMAERRLCSLLGGKHRPRRGARCGVRAPREQGKANARGKGEKKERREGG